MGTWFCFIATLFICLFGFVTIDLFVVSKNVAIHPWFESASLTMANDICETHTHSLSVTVEANGMKLQYSVDITYSTVCSGHHSSLLLHNHSNTSKTFKMGTENVNTTTKRECCLIKDELFAKLLVYIESFTYVKHMLHSCSSSSNPGFRECKLACLLHLQHYLVSQTQNDRPVIRL